MRGYPKPLCILFSDTKGIQWVDTVATDAIGVSSKGIVKGFTRF